MGIQVSVKNTIDSDNTTADVGINPKILNTPAINNG
jgi:hypothetical protein